ncbi:hypothetical protein KAS42_00220, partial [bacterium]|nr:hypothetical protein [bacterium]
MNKDEIVKYFELFSNPDGDGLERFLSSNGEKEVFLRLANINKESLSKVELDQLLIISGLTGMSYGYFKYYWLMASNKHSYPVDKLEDYDEGFLNKEKVISLQHLRWGLRRIYTDSLLYYGHITNGFNRLNIKTEEQLINFFEGKRFPTEKIKMRGRPLDFKIIPQEDRYLISEMACKTYEAPADSEQNLKQFLIDNYIEAKKQGRNRVTVRDLFSKDFVAESKKKYENHLSQLEFSAEDILDRR